MFPACAIGNRCRALVVGTGPSLREQISNLPYFDGRLFILNNCYAEPWVKEQYQRSGIRPVWIACDPKWHELNGQVFGRWFDKWHWRGDIARKYGYHHVQGIWHDGLWLEDKTKISLNHGSAPQAINLACHYDCTEIVLVGHDFDYPKGKPRHYFDNLSDVAGEYPEPLRKWSQFIKNNGRVLPNKENDDLLAVYKRIADTPGRPKIYNATPGSKLPWFPYRDLQEFLV